MSGLLRVWPCEACGVGLQHFGYLYIGHLQLWQDDKSEWPMQQLLEMIITLRGSRMAHWRQNFQSAVSTGVSARACAVNDMWGLTNEL